MQVVDRRALVGKGKPHPNVPRGSVPQAAPALLRKRAGAACQGRNHRNGLATDRVAFAHQNAGSAVRNRRDLAERQFIGSGRDASQLCHEIDIRPVAVDGEEFGNRHAGWHGGVGCPGLRDHCGRTACQSRHQHRLIPSGHLAARL